MPSPQAYASRGRHPPPAQVLENMSIGGSLYDEEGAKIVPEIMARSHAQSAVLAAWWRQSFAAPAAWES